METAWLEQGKKQDDGIANTMKVTKARPFDLVTSIHKT